MGNIVKNYGELVFGRREMKNRMSVTAYKNMVQAVDHGEAMDENMAEDVARAMKEWALENDATHFTHWFQPQRNGTAEKHDSFIAYSKDGEVIEKFSASQLIQSEPDASSFPSGGIRSTFEARGYTGWDPSSPAFLRSSANGKSLVIPSLYLSWTGEALDMKTPLLRSIESLNKYVIKFQKLLGNRAAKRIKVFSGLEQEYFLIPIHLAEHRPDLMICGRTVFGKAPSKGQSMDDHYFGAIPPKIMEYMMDLDQELYRHGIPAKTKHNEVAPNQFELAPLYEEVNLAIDHNLQTMDIMRRVAESHDLMVFHHEKPFAGLNGSGKHVNWSLSDNTGTNYLEPSKSP
ncbi:MAG: glutamine synthetase, partial [Candidatus Marinamargulisbacteria bacterium]